MMFKILELMGIETRGYDRLMVHFTGLKSPASLWICIGVIILFCISAYFMVKPLSGLRRKVFILALHFIALIFAISIFLEPSLRLAKTAKLKSPIYILIDSSESMKAKASADQSRIQNALNWLEKNHAYFNALKNDYEVRWFRFDEKATSLQANFLDMPKISPDGQQTQILESIYRLKSELGDKRLAGLVIISDGADRGELSQIGSEQNPREKAKQLKDMERRVQGLGKIYTVLVAEEAGMKDLAITSVQHDGYGFVKNPFVVVVKLKMIGEDVKEVPVQLYQGQKLVAGKSVKLENGKEQSVELEFIPDQVGRFLFRVEVPVYQDEASVENNQKVFPLTILRDRIRILYIAGNPSWDEKFLRRTLEKNPSVDLVSFYILREMYDNPEASEQELALIPFPTQELFQKELPNFDIVIFQNFFGRDYMSPSYLENLRDYVVDQGGAFIYIGGPRAFIKDSFNFPLEQILPVDFSFGETNYQISRLSLRLTDAGALHPLTNLAGGELENKSLWQGIGVLENYNQVLRVKPDAVVLVEHTQSNPGTLIAVREVGKGRVLMIATDSFWRFRFEQEGQEGQTKYYQLFWERALRWLVKDPEMKNHSLSLFKDKYQPGEDINIYFNVQDRSYQPVSGATVSLKAVQAPEGCSPAEMPGEEIAPGKYQFKLNLNCPGGYKLQAIAEKEGLVAGTDEAVLAVEKDSQELQDLSIRKDLMELLARAGDGELLKIPDSPAKMKFPDINLEEIIGAKDIPVWNNWLTLTIFVLLFGIFWAVRRYYSLS